MKKRVEYIFLFAHLSLLGCNSTIKNDEFVGVWFNENEKCNIELNKDFTFKSTNVPLDVANEYYLNFNKQEKTWQGIWSLEGKQLKLTVNSNSYYYLDVNKGFLTGKSHLSVKLLDESGGKMIYFDKK
jgi:hypothetical protein